MMYDFFSSPQIAQIFTDYFISSLPIVIQRSIATKDLGCIHVFTHLYVPEILHYTAFRSDELLRTLSEK